MTIHFTCSDSLSGIPDGACPADQTLRSEGKTVQSTAQTVKDAVGNVSAPSNTISVKVDKTAPTTLAAVTKSPNKTGWYKGNVKIHFTCSDALSGIPKGACPADQVLSSEGTAVQSFAQAVTGCSRQRHHLEHRNGEDRQKRSHLKPQPSAPTRCCSTVTRRLPQMPAMALWCRIPGLRYSRHENPG